MKLNGRCAVVTGGCHGIGRALAEELATRGANVVVADLNERRAHRVADRVGGVAMHCDVASPGGIDRLVFRAEREFGPVSVFCSNAGYSDNVDGLTEAPEDIRRIVEVNMLSHVWAAQAVLPAMLEQGEGWLIQTISSAALITGPSFMGYTMTKHGALGFAERV